MIGVASQQRAAVLRRVVAEPGGKGGDPRLIDRRRQGDRQQKAERLGAFAGKIGQIHPQRLAADALRRIVGQKMHAGNDAVGGQNQIAAGRRRDCRRVIAEPEGAGMRRQRTEVARDQALLG